MRCPWYLFHRLFWLLARTQGPHDPLLPGGPMSCQSAPGYVPSPFFPPQRQHLNCGDQAVT
ncbi:unnamed protein product, partial [Staurois parvus]